VRLSQLLSAGLLLIAIAVPGQVLGAPDDAEVKAPVGWRAGDIGLDLDISTSLDSGSEGEPFSMAPDLWYVPTDRLRLVFGHSAQSAGGYYGTSAGSGLCLSGTAGGCPQVYDAFNLGADFLVNRGKLNLVAWARGVVATDRSLYGATVGANLSRAVMRSGKLIVGANPNLYQGFNKRGGANIATLNLAAYVVYVLSPTMLAAVQTGLVGPLDSFVDAFAVPVSLTGMYRINSNMGAGLAFAFRNLVGNGRSIDGRSVSILVTWAK